MSAQASFFEQLKAIRKVITETSDRRLALQDLEKYLEDPAILREFFRMIDRSDWIDPLQELGYFDNPPKTERVSGGGIRYPRWPAATYLAGMARIAPEKVAAIFARLDTDNDSVLADVLNAALAMPTEVAAKLVPALCRAAEAGQLWLAYKDASELAARLASENQADAALSLARSLFGFRSPVGAEGPRRRDDYRYLEGLKKVLPPLVLVRPEQFLPAMCDWLHAAIAGKASISGETEWDYSYMWRPAIEEHDQNRAHDFAGALVGLVRDAFETAIGQGRISLNAALLLLGKYSYLVFKRLRVHLINVFAEEDQGLARRTIMNREMLDDHWYKHEYAMLVGRRFALLEPKERQTWLAWIDAGPDMSEFAANFKSHTGREPTDADRLGRAQYWQFERLHWIRDHVEGKWGELYRQMLKERGEPTLADLNVRTGRVEVGDRSPYSIEQLKNLSFSEAVEKVAAWSPSQPDQLGPSIDGLASTFGQFVAGNPVEFSKQSEKLKERPLIFVRAFINQMREVAKRGEELDVPAVLHLCDWILEYTEKVKQPPPQEADAVGDETQWTRDAVTEFILGMCEATVDKQPRYPMEGTRDQIAGMLDRLTRDTAQSYIVHDPANDELRLYDFFSLGLNSPRGKAVHALLEYARWIARHTAQDHSGREIVPGGFKSMPEVKAMLEWQLAIENGSFEAWAVLGSHIGVMYWIDKGWLEQQIGTLFDLTKIEEHPRTAYGWAAWNAFLVWVEPHAEFYRLLDAQFEYAVEQSAQVKIEERNREQPMHRLGEHLMILYGRGQLDFESNGLIRRFLSRAVPEIRTHAIWFVGSSLQGEGVVPPDVIDRFVALWDWYWLVKGKSDAEQHPQLETFTSWFTCGKFPNPWSLERLWGYVQLVPTSDADFMIAEKLAEVGSADFDLAVRILHRMVESDVEGWRVSGWLTPARALLKSATSAGGTAHKGAVQVIDLLGRRGYTELGELLTTS